MSEKSQLISSDSLQTVVAVCFVLALLSVAFNFYNFTRINHVFGFMAELHQFNMQNVTESMGKNTDDIDAITKRLDAMDKKMAGMAAPAAPAAEAPK